MSLLSISMTSIKHPIRLVKKEPEIKTVGKFYQLLHSEDISESITNITTSLAPV